MNHKIYNGLLSNNSHTHRFVNYHKETRRERGKKREPGKHMLAAWNNSYSHAVNGNSPTSGVVLGQDIVFIRLCLNIFPFFLGFLSLCFSSSVYSVHNGLRQREHFIGCMRNDESKREILPNR